MALVKNIIQNKRFVAPALLFNRSAVCGG